MPSSDDTQINFDASQLQEITTDGEAALDAIADAASVGDLGQAWQMPRTRGLYLRRRK